MKLIAVQPFDSYAVGTEITDKAEIEAILASEKSGFVTKVASDAVEAAPDSEKKPKR